MKTYLMAAMRKPWLSVIALGSILLMFPAVSPAADGSLEQRVQALEKALQEQKEASPQFSYKPRKGVKVEAADKSWGIDFRGRFHERMMFWDSQAKHSAGFDQGDLALRRLRPRWDFYWDDAFYTLSIELNIGSDLGVAMQTGVLEVDFSQMSKALPTLDVGPKVSTFFNKHDTNWGSSTGGLFDRSMFQDGAGLGAGSQYNALGLTWDKLRIGPGQMMFQFVYSNNGVVGSDDATLPKTGKRAFHLGWHYSPFAKSKNKLIKGLDVGVGYQIDHVLPGLDGRDFFRVRTTERNRLNLITVDADLDPESARTYITPGFGWKIGPNWLRTAYAYNKGTFADGQGDIKGRMWRVADELFIWSPKGMFTGSTKKGGSIMLFAGFERDDYEADNDLIGGRDSANASNLNLGFWYFIREGFRVGAEYGRYHVDHIAGGGKGAGALNDVEAGDSVDFDTFELGLTFDF